MYEVPVSARARSDSTRTFDGPLPNRPSAGSNSSGMRISAVWSVMARNIHGQGRRAVPENMCH